MDCPGPTERKMSFNPEAIAFSPTAATTSQVLSGSATHAELSRLINTVSQASEVPRCKSFTSQKQLATNYNVVGSPFRPSKSLRPDYIEEPSSSHTPASLHELVSSSLPVVGQPQNFGSKLKIVC